MNDNRVRVGELTYYSGLDDLSTMSEPDRIRWFEGRFDKTVVRPLRAVQRLGVSDPDLWDLNLGVVTIVCSAIQALGSFHSPSRKDRIAFVTFVQTFMSPVFSQTALGRDRTYAEILYDQFRCGLAHGFSIVGHEVATRPSEYLADDSGYVSIDLWSLFEDMESGFSRYTGCLGTDAVARANFLKRFDDVFVRPYSKRALSAARTGQSK